MAVSDSESNGSSIPTVFLCGVVVGGIGGGIAGWLLGGHVTPFLTSVISILARDPKSGPVRFEAMQQ
jgi:hypothetical protein